MPWRCDLEPIISAGADQLCPDRASEVAECFCREVSLPPIATGILALRQALGFGIGVRPSKDAPNALTEESIKNARARSEPSKRKAKLKTKWVKPEDGKTGSKPGSAGKG